MKLAVFSALLCFFPLAAVAGQEPAAQASQPAPTPTDRKADAYADFILGHINQMEFEDTGKADFADKAIEYFKKAQSLDPDAVAISREMARTYAEARHLPDAVLTAQAILKTHPDDLETHQLLAQIYVQGLGESGSAPDQQNTLQLAIEQYETVLRLDPGEAEAGLWLARLYRFERQPEKAEKVLGQLLRADPSNERALEEYTQILLDQGQADQAIARLSSAVGEQGSGRLYDMLGDAYVQTHQNSLAIEAFRHATEVEPGVASHWRLLAQALFQQDRFAEAANAYEKLTSLDPSDQNNFIRLAEIYYQLKKYPQAEASIQQARQLAPDDFEVVYNEALIASAQGRFSDAIAQISGAISALKRRSSDEPADPRLYGILYEELGQLYRRQGNFTAAVDAYRRFMALGPEQEQRGRLDLIETYRENDDLDDAIATAHQAMTADPKDQQMQITYALLLGENEKTDDAVKILKGLLAGAPADRTIYLDIAQVEQRGRRYADAEKAADTAESMAQLPQEKAAAWFLLGAIYERQKKYAQAELLFQKTLQVNPNDAEVLNDYGYMLTEEGIRLDQATDMIKHALAEDANNGAYLDSLGWTYFRQNRLADARVSMLKAVARSPHDPTLLGHLGDVYDALGDTDLAVATWQKALIEWHRAVPADYEPDQVREIERDLARAKSRTAHKNRASANPLH